LKKGLYSGNNSRKWKEIEREYDLVEKMAGKETAVERIKNNAGRDRLSSGLIKCML